MRLVANEGEMIRVLITGMSGTGKSTLIRELAARGYKAVDADEGGYSELVEVPEDELTGPGPGKDWLWREERIQELLATEDSSALFVSGCAPNQGKFYPQFDHIVLLSAPPSLIIDRLTKRTNNAFGKDPDQLERTLQLMEIVEPALRRRATLEIDTSLPVQAVAEAVLRLTEPGQS